MADIEKILHGDRTARSLSGSLSTVPGCFVGKLPGTLVFHTNCGTPLQIDDTLKLENGVLSVNVEVEIATSAVATHLDLSDWENGSFSVEWDSGEPTQCRVEFDADKRPISLSDGETTMAITWPVEEANS